MLAMREKCAIAFGLLGIFGCSGSDDGSSETLADDSNLQFRTIENDLALWTALWSQTVQVCFIKEGTYGALDYDNSKALVETTVQAGWESAMDLNLQFNGDCVAPSPGSWLKIILGAYDMAGGGHCEPPLPGASTSTVCHLGGLNSHTGNSKWVITH